MSPCRQTVMFFCPVPGDRRVTHAGEQFLELFRLGISELDELEPVGAGRVLRADPGGRCVVREGTHGNSPRLAPFPRPEKWEGVARSATQSGDFEKL
jgi:hypothetical protein